MLETDRLDKLRGYGLSVTKRVVFFVMITSFAEFYF